MITSLMISATLAGFSAMVATPPAQAATPENAPRPASGFVLTSPNVEPDGEIDASFDDAKILCFAPKGGTKGGYGASI